jgi:hypothetical protein
MKLVSEAITRKVARASLLTQKNSPGILFGVGIVGVVGSTVLACRATLKMEEILSEGKDKMDMARNLEHAEYSEIDRRRDLTLIRTQTGVKIVRAYAPAIIVGGLSIAALTKSHDILTKRNAALTAAYAALDRGFREYRARVIAKYGEEEDRNLRYGTREVKTIDPETKEEKLSVRVAPGEPSIYARFFDNNSTMWSKNPEYNLILLKAQQNYANDLLKARGHVFLNEVYDMLGIERTKAGAVVGWILSGNGETDNFVNFGVFDGRTQAARDFVNGFEGAILLDFNVDGVIFDKIEGDMEALSWQLGH